MSASVRPPTRKQSSSRAIAGSIRRRSSPTPTGQSAEQARKDLLATGLFSSVSVTGRPGALVVSVKENEVINRVVFQGAKKLKPEQLTQEVQSKARGPFSQAVVDSDVERLKQIYKAAGAATRPSPSRVVPLENGRVDVVFDIKEGDKTGIKSIDFVGNKAFSSGRLRDQMATTESNLLSFLKSSDVYDPDRIASDLELIRRLYLKHGYADFRVIGTDVKYDDASNGYRITVTVEEGQQYKVGDVRVDSRIPDVDSGAPAQAGEDRSGFDLQFRGGREDTPGDHDRCDGQGLCVLAGPPAGQPRSRDRRPSASPTSSRKVRASTSSGSTSSATPVRATTSFAASSTSARATPTTRS